MSATTLPSAGALNTRWQVLDALATAVQPPALPTVVVAPHPDDETLMAGGLIRIQRRRGLPVLVVAVTDGERAYPGTALDLGPVRVEEQEAACAALGMATGAEAGAGAEGIVRLGVRDGEVPGCEADVAARVGAVLDDLLGGSPDGCLLVAPWTGDHHSDHEAVGRACTTAAAGRPGVRLWYGLFWTYHHRRPAALDGHHVMRVALDEEVMTARRAAVAAHRTQVVGVPGVGPMLGERALAPMDWPHHHFLSPWGVAG